MLYWVCLPFYSLSLFFISHIPKGFRFLRVGGCLCRWKMMSGRSSKYPFTASQWQELEHQALIFKCMASGTPIPHDLLLPIKRSFYLDSSCTPPYHNGGCGCFQMGFGRKAEDPEPWRCRRTDGKKWRCSKESYPDSKYCERHMHRGKNLSRKPVEMLTSPSSTTVSKPSLYPPNLSMAAAAESHHVMDPYTSRHGGLGFGSAAHFHMDTASSVYRHSHGLKQELDQYIALANSSGAKERSWQFTRLGVSSPVEHRRSSCSPSLQDGSRLAMLELPKEREHEQKEKRQHCFVLGADVGAERPAAMAEGEGEPRRALLHFFDDWPLRARETWMDAGEEQLVWGGFPKTQLSISIPMAHHDFPAAGSRPGGADD